MKTRMKITTTQRNYSRQKCTKRDLKFAKSRLTSKKPNGSG